MEPAQHGTDPKKAPRSFGALFVFCIPLVYLAEMASTGQESTHAAQSVQVLASMTKMSSPWLIASTGQVGSHAPQEIHSFEITCAMIVLLVFLLAFLLHKGGEYNSKFLDCIHNITA